MLGAPILETPGATAEPCVAGADDGTTLLAAVVSDLRRMGDTPRVVAVARPWDRGTHAPPVPKTDFITPAHWCKRNGYRHHNT